jgi:hypothetical protein
MNNHRWPPLNARTTPAILWFAFAALSLTNFAKAQCNYEVTAIIQAPSCPFVAPPVTIERTSTTLNAASIKTATTAAGRRRAGIHSATAQPSSVTGITTATARRTGRDVSPWLRRARTKEVLSTTFPSAATPNTSDTEAAPNALRPSTPDYW